LPQELPRTGKGTKDLKAIISPIVSTGNYNPANGLRVIYQILVIYGLRGNSKEGCYQRFFQCLITGISDHKSYERGLSLPPYISKSRIDKIMIREGSNQLRADGNDNPKGPNSTVESRY